MYATRDGISIAAKPSFKIEVKSLDSPYSWNPRARARMMEMILNENRSRKSDTPTPVEFTVNLGPSKTTYHSSGVPPAPARKGVKSTRMSKGLLLAGTVGIAFVAPEAVAEVLLVGGVKLGIAAAGSLNVLTDMVEADTEFAERRAAGRILWIGSDGRVFPTGYMASSTDCKGAGCLGGYVYRDLFTPGRPSIFKNYIIGTLIGEVVPEKVFPHNEFMKIPLGEFALNVVEDGMTSQGQYGHYDPNTQQWMPSALTLSLQNMPPTPSLQSAPQHAIIAPKSADSSPAPVQAGRPPLGPPEIAPYMPPTPVAVTTYRTAPLTPTWVSPSAPASAPAVSPTTTVTTTSDVPSISSSTSRHSPTGITGGKDFGSFTLHY